MAPVGKTISTLTSLPYCSGQFIRTGFFRPAGTIKDLLDLLTETLIERGATIITGTGVEHLRVVDDRVESVILENG